MTETKLQKARRRFMGCSHVLSREHTMQPILDALDENDALRGRAEKAEAERDEAREERDRLKADLNLVIARGGGWMEHGGFHVVDVARIRAEAEAAALERAASAVKALGYRGNQGVDEAVSAIRALAARGQSGGRQGNG